MSGSVNNRGPPAHRPPHPNPLRCNPPTEAPSSSTESDGPAGVRGNRNRERSFSPPSPIGRSSSTNEDTTFNGVNGLNDDWTPRTKGEVLLEVTTRIINDQDDVPSTSNLLQYNPRREDLLPSIRKALSYIEHIVDFQRIAGWPELRAKWREISEQPQNIGLLPVSVLRLMLMNCWSDIKQAHEEIDRNDAGK